MSTRVVGESRRSTRVPLQILITLLSLDEPLTCDGETITVSRHGALISSGVPLRKEMNALEKPENIWDLSHPPDDWYDNAHES